MNDEQLKKLLEKYPQLDKILPEIHSEADFDRLAPDIPKSVWYELAPSVTPVPQTTTENQQSSQPKAISTHRAYQQPHAHAESHGYRPAHDIEEDRVYQNIVKNHVEDWNKQNPQNKFTEKIFIKDNTGKLILNPTLQKIPNIASDTRQTMRLGYGDESVDKYNDAEKYRVYKNRTQDPTYTALQAIKSDTAYDQYVNLHPEKAFAYARKDKEMKKAIQRRNKRLETAYKEKQKKYKNPKDDPAFQRLHSDIEASTNREYQSQLEKNRQPLGPLNPASWQEKLNSSPTQSTPPQIDREQIRDKIKQMKYDEFIRAYPEKAKAYSKKDPVLKAAYEEFKKREKLARKQQEKDEKQLKKLSRKSFFSRFQSSKPNKPQHIQAIEANIQKKVQSLNATTSVQKEDQVRNIRRKTYESFVRENPTIAKELSAASEDIRAASERVNAAHAMGQKRNIAYRIKSKLLGKAPKTQATPSTPTQAPSLSQQPILSLDEWKSRIRSANTKAPTPPKKNENQDEQDAWRGRGLNRMKSYFQSNHAPEGVQRMSSENPSGSNSPTRRFSPKRIRRRPPAGTNQAEKAAINLGKQGVMTIGRAILVYAGPWLLLILLFLIVILAIYLAVSGDDDSDFQINVSKVGPTGVPNPESPTDEKANIDYDITVNYTGEAEKIVVTDAIPENAEFVSAGQNAKTYDASGKETSVASEVQKVVWEIIVGTSGGSGNGTIDVNSTSLNKIMEDSATNANIPIAFFKAIIKVETGGAITDYTDDDVVKLSAKDWWVGRLDNAPNVNDNDPLIIRGFAFNTCQYHPGCSPPTDVRGISQFLLETFEGLKSQIPTDGHEPDRRYIRDALYASGLYHAENAAWYDNAYGTSSNEWPEDKIRKVATAYCTGDINGNANDPACAQAGVSYAELTWRYYQEYLAN